MNGRVPEAASLLFHITRDTTWRAGTGSFPEIGEIVADAHHGDFEVRGREREHRDVVALWGGGRDDCGAPQGSRGAERGPEEATTKRGQSAAQWSDPYRCGRDQGPTRQTRRRAPPRPQTPPMPSSASI